MTAYDHTEHSVHDYQPSHGDAIFVAGKAFISKAIKWFTRGRWEPKTFASHVAVMRDKLTMVHAVWPRIKKDNVRVYLDDLLDKRYDLVIMGRTVPPTQLQIINMQTNLDNWFRADGVYQLYAFGEFIPFAIDGLAEKVLGGRRVWARRLCDLMPNVVCSGLVARAHIAAYWAGHDTRFDSPDCMLDRLWLDKKGWTVKAITPGAAQRLGLRYGA